MTAPVRHDLYVIYDVEDPASTATTLRFPNAIERDQHIVRLKDIEKNGGTTFQLVPNLRFVRFQPEDPARRLASKVRDVVVPLAARRKVPSGPWFIDPRTGDHVKRHWTPGKDIVPFSEFEAKLEALNAPVPARRRSRRPS